MTREKVDPTRPIPQDLNVLYRVREAAPPWLGELLRSGRFHTFELPTEFVLYPGDEPGTRRKIGEALRLRTGRVYRPGLYLHDRRFMTYQELHALIPRTAAVRKAFDTGLVHTFNTSAIAGREAFVAEVWEDHGDDGHTDYELRGHILYIEQHFPRTGVPLYRRIADFAYECEDRHRKAVERREAALKK